jgi:adenosylcobinamide-phosphate synthase
MSILYLVPEGLIVQLSILVLGLGLDLVIGEPPEAIHPTVLIGRTTEWLREKLGRSKSRCRLFGSILALIVLLSATGSVFILLEVARRLLGQLGYIILGGLILKTSFAIKSMELHTKPIKGALEGKDLVLAREAVGKIVRRNTKQLDDGLCASATIESVAEGTVDGIISPLFYFFLLGVPGAIAFRAINTLDSTIGYKDAVYSQIGWFSAKLDSLANFVPARLTALIMVMAAAILHKDWKSSLSTMRREHDKTESLNAGYPMSAMAGALGVRLEKVNSYQLGEGLNTPSHKDITPAIGIMRLTTSIFLALTLTISTVIMQLH